MASFEISASIYMGLSVSKMQDQPFNHGTRTTTLFDCIDHLAVNRRLCSSNKPFDNMPFSYSTWLEIRGTITPARTLRTNRCLHTLMQSILFKTCLMSMGLKPSMSCCAQSQHPGTGSRESLIESTRGFNQSMRR